MIDNNWGQFKRLLAGLWVPALFALFLFVTLEFATNATAQQSEKIEIHNVQPTVSQPISNEDHTAPAPTTTSLEKEDPTTLEEHFFQHYLQSTGLHDSAEAKHLAKELISLCKQNNTYPEVTLARLMIESNACHYVPGTKQVKRGSHGEYGISQVHPSWINKSLNGVTITRDKLEDPIENIKIGMLIYKRYETDPNNYIMAVTHYNRPGCRTPNSYARRVDRKYKEIRNYYRLWAESRFMQKTDLKLLVTHDYGV